MNRYLLCPVSTSRVNEAVARFNAGITIIFLISFYLTGNLIFILFLFADFLLRGAERQNYSLITLASGQIVKAFWIKGRLINAGPKIFAARIGAFLTGIIIIAALIPSQYIVYLMMGVLGLFSLLESLFGFCVACKIYPFLFRVMFRQKYSGN